MGHAGLKKVPSKGFSEVDGIASRNCAERKTFRNTSIGYAPITDFFLLINYVGMPVI